MMERIIADQSKFEEHAMYTETCMHKTQQNEAPYTRYRWYQDNWYSIEYNTHTLSFSLSLYIYMITWSSSVGADMGYCFIL